MKKSLFRFAVLLLVAVFFITTIACEQPSTPEVPPSSEDNPNPTPDPTPEPEPEPEPEPISIWDIQSFDDLFKFATGAYTVDPENLPPLGEEDMSVAVQVAKGILLADGSEFDSDNKESITLEFFGNNGAYGKMLIYAGADSLQICNGEITYGGDVLRMVDCAIAFGDSGPYVASGSILLNDMESDFATATGIIDEASAEFFDYYSLTNMEQGNATYSLLQTAHVVGEDSDMSDTVYYTAEVDGKTVTVSVNPFLVYPVDDRRIEYIAIDEVLYNATGVAEFVYSDIQSVSIYNVKYNEVYETGNDAVITMEPENVFGFYPVTYPDTDAAYKSGFSWSLTDSEGNPTDAATLTLDEETGLLTLTAVYGGSYTLTLTSDAKPELSCSVAIVIDGPQKIDVERPEVSMALPEMSEFATGVTEPVQGEDAVTDANPGLRMTILKNCLDFVNPGSGTTEQTSVFSIPAHDGISGKINYPRGRAPGFVTVYRYHWTDTASRL